jgi:hypothetical protein
MEASATEEKMRRLTIAFLISCLLGISAGSAVVAQTPSPSPSLDAVPLRVEVPEAGFAATFPEGWVVETIFGDSGVVSPDASTRCLTFGERFDERIDDPAAFLDKIAAIWPNFSDDGPLPVIETSEIELPAGRAIRFIADFTLDPEFDESDSDSARYLTTYILTDGLGFLTLACYAPERPDDDWLSIAETIEFLPIEE